MVKPRPILRDADLVGADLSGAVLSRAVTANSGPWIAPIKDPTAKTGIRVIITHKKGNHP